MRAPPRPALLLGLLLAGCAAGDTDPLPDTDPGPDTDTDPGPGTDTDPGPDTPPTLAGISPRVVDPQGGSRVVLTGTALDGVTSVRIGGAPAAILSAEPGRIVALTGPVEPGDGLPVAVAGPGGTASLGGAVEAWSPDAIPGARVFDAASGVAAEEARTDYAWQRLTAEISPDWRVRDGNTLTWLPATGRFWMVGGWNGYQAPDGFSEVEPGTWPPQNTTNEVWSSPDGVAWTAELPHGHPQFERRHIHDALLWRDRLWVIGGDSWQGRHNHDVLSSPDGVTWTAELPPGAPPWEPRDAQISGVFQGDLWTGGGQNLLGDTSLRFRNDLWRSADGVSWTQVAADGPASETRWGGCGFVTGFVAFRDRMWLLGCARYDEVGGHDMRNEVWSTADGVTWTRHAEPPWKGKIFHNALAWDGKLWVLFGYTAGDPANGWPAGNANEVWYSEDGEAWTALPHDAPAPGSHAQGVAVTDGALVMAGGNHTFGFGAGLDRSVWRLVPWRGAAVASWADRGEALVASAPSDAARPLLVPDAFGPGMPGLHFDGSAAHLALPEPDLHAGGRTILWAGRAPYLPAPWGWEETYSPLGTVVGGPDATGYPNSPVGLSAGGLLLVNREPGAGPYGEPLWSYVRAGAGLQEGPGEVRLVGLSHAADGAVTAWIDGAPTPAGQATWGEGRAWSRIGSGMDGDGYYGPNTRFAGELGAVLVLPGALDAATAERIHAWAQGRFGAR